MVSPARRMSSAISFGVFCRLAPSTSAIMRSRKLSPARLVTVTTISSESTRVPPVTAQRSPPDSRITGADSPVIADSSTLAMPSITSPSAGMISPAVTTTWSPTVELRARQLLDRAVGEPPPGRRLGAGLAQRRRLRLAAPLRHRLGEVREEDGEPEPGRDAACEDVRLRRRVAEVLEEEDRGERGADLRHEHDGVARHPPRVELAEAVERCRGGDRRIEEGGRCFWVLTGSGAPGRGRGKRRGST